jgi:hypothetical protein
LETINLTKTPMQHVDAGAVVVVPFGVVTRTDLSKVKDSRLILLHPRHFLGGVEHQTPVDEAIASMDLNQDITFTQILELVREDQHRTAAAHRLHGFCKGRTATFRPTTLDNKGSTSLSLKSSNLERIQWYRLSTWTGSLQRKFPKWR